MREIGLRFISEILVLYKYFALLITWERFNNKTWGRLIICFFYSWFPIIDPDILSLGFWRTNRRDLIRRFFPLSLATLIRISFLLYNLVLRFLINVRRFVSLLTWCNTFFVFFLGFNLFHSPSLIACLSIFLNLPRLVFNVDWNLCFHSLVIYILGSH